MSYRSLRHKKIHKKQNDRKGRYSLAHFLEKFKKVKIVVKGPKKAQFLNVFSYQKRRFPVLWLHFYLFSFLSKYAPEYIDLFGHFVFNEILCSSILFCWTSPRRCSQGSGGWIQINFFTIGTFTERIRMTAIYINDEVIDFLNFGEKKFKIIEVSKI